MDKNLSRRPRWVMLALVVTVLVLGAGNAWAATGDQRLGPVVPTAPAADSGAKQPRCVHGCERWAKVCNVDPRGVYKCQRRCEKFGEICE